MSDIEKYLDPRPPSNVLLNITVPPAQKQALKDIADDYGTNVSAVVRALIARELETNQYHRG